MILYNLRKKIFIVQNTELDSLIGGSVYLTSLLKNFIVDDKHHISIVISKSKSIPPEVVQVCKKIIQISTSLYSVVDNIRFSWETFKQLKKEQRVCSIEVIHCIRPNSSLLGAVLFKFFSNWDVKILYDVRSPWIEMSIERGFIPRWVAPIYKWFLYLEELILLRFTNWTVFITDSLREYYNGRIKVNVSHSTVIPSGVDMKRFTYTKSMIREQYGITRNNILLGIVGGLSSERDLHFLIRALKELAIADSRYELMFVGDGPERESLEQYADSLKISQNIFFAGKVQHNQVREYISCFDIGICQLPDAFIFRQSFPLKILEYLSCGIPVIASNIRANRDIADILKNISIYQFSVRSFSETVQHMVLNKPYHGNDELLRRDYDWQSLSRVYSSIYDQL